MDNFELEIYKITKRAGEDVLIRIEDLTEINKLFSIKTDHDASEKDYKNLKKNNYYRKYEE